MSDNPYSYDPEAELTSLAYSTLDKERVVKLSDAIKIAKAAKMQGILFHLHTHFVISPTPAVARAINSVEHELRKLLGLKELQDFSVSKNTAEYQKAAYAESAFSYELTKDKEEKDKFTPGVGIDKKYKHGTPISVVLAEYIKDLPINKELPKKMIYKDFDGYARETVAMAIGNARKDDMIIDGRNKRYFIRIK